MTRLIDAEQIVTMELFDEEHEEYYKKKISIEDMIATYTTEMELPTVDAVPVRHGKWEKIPSSYEVTYECSECGEKTDETIMGLPRYVYCPMCGADMRGEENDRK